MLDLYSPYIGRGRYDAGWRERVFRRFRTLTLNNAILGITEQLVPPDSHDFVVVTHINVQWAPGPTASQQPSCNVVLAPLLGPLFFLFGLDNVVPIAGALPAGVPLFTTERGPWVFMPGDQLLVNASYGLADAANRVDVSVLGYAVSVETLNR